MSHRPADPTALPRGAAAGALTATLTLAAHGAAGGTIVGAAAALLAVLATGFGALAGLQRGADPRVLAGLLAAGQLAGHYTMAAAGHLHAHPLTPAMLSAHLLAAVVGALLVTGAEHLCRVLRTVLRTTSGTGTAIAPAGGAPIPVRPEFPSQSRLLITASISHRGPPAGSR